VVNYIASAVAFESSLSKAFEFW